MFIIPLQSVVSNATFVEISVQSKFNILLLLIWLFEKCQWQRQKGLMTGISCCRSVGWIDCWHGGKMLYSQILTGLTIQYVTADCMHACMQRCSEWYHMCSTSHSTAVSGDHMSYNKTKWSLLKLSLTAVSLDIFQSRFGEIHTDKGYNFGKDIV